MDCIVHGVSQRFGHIEQLSLSLNSVLIIRDLTCKNTGCPVKYQIHSKYVVIYRNNDKPDNNMKIT